MSGFNIFALFQNSFAGLFIYWLYYHTGAKKIKIFLYFLVSLVFLFMSNAKSPLFVLILSSLIIYYYRKKRIKLTYIFFGCFFLMIIFITWEVVFREYFVIGEIVTIKGDVSFIDNFSLKFGDFFLGNFMQLQTFSIILDSYPSSNSYFFGSSLLMIFVIWVPRLVFPDKPLTAAGEFTLDIWPDKYLTNGTTLPPGLIGEFFLNFSWIGIVLGMFFVGYFYGFVWKKFRDNRDDFVFSICAIIFTSLLIHFFRGELSAPLLSGIFFILPLFLIRFLQEVKK
jgi:oligosaccharide repeat unit polymerase